MNLKLDWFLFSIKGILPTTVRFPPLHQPTPASCFLGILKTMKMPMVFPIGFQIPIAYGTRGIHAGRFPRFFKYFILGQQSNISMFSIDAHYLFFLEKVCVNIEKHMLKEFCCDPWQNRELWKTELGPRAFQEFPIFPEVTNIGVLWCSEKMKEVSYGHIVLNILSGHGSGAIVQM